MQVQDIITNTYDGCEYTIIKVGSAFIITMVINGKLHRGHIVATRNFYQKIFLLGYTKKQLDSITKYCIKIAENTIDNVKKS